jgi:exopolysaccharide biosynthesis protein
VVRAYPGGSGAGTQVAHGDTLQLHLAARSAVSLVDGDTVTLQIGLMSPGARPVRQAVGGRPILVVDSAIARDVDTEGQASFRDLNPRTALGLDRSGTRLWLAVIDGRQQGSSMGMTLRQTGELLRALGAVQAINLDGGGSSALVVRDPANGATRLMNHPSDPTGERPVGNALAVFSTCSR